MTARDGRKQYLTDKIQRNSSQTELQKSTPIKFKMFTSNNSYFIKYMTKYHSPGTCNAKRNKAQDIKKNFHFILNGWK